MKRIITLLIAMTIIFTGCTSSKTEDKEDVEFTSTIVLSDENITVDDIDVMSITAITIDGDENIEIIPKAPEEEEEEPF